MDRLRSSVLIAAAFVIVVAVLASRTFLTYRPPVPGTTVSLDDTSLTRTNFQTPAGNAPRLGDSSSLTTQRLARLQDVIRSQRTELISLRSAMASADPPKPEKPPVDRASKKPGLLSRLPDLSLFLGEGDDGTKLSREELSERLTGLREVAVELEEQLLAAESVVEMQSAEIEELQAEVNTTRERVAAIADAREDLDAVVNKLLEESRDLEGVARQTLIQLGPSAGAVLLTLDEQRPHVRAWISEVLAAIDKSDDPRP